MNPNEKELRDKVAEIFRWLPLSNERNHVEIQIFDLLSTQIALAKAENWKVILNGAEELRKKNKEKEMWSDDYYVGLRELVDIARLHFITPSSNQTK